MGALIQALVKSVFTTAVVFIIIILLSSFQNSVGAGAGDALIADTQIGVVQFLTLPPAQYMPFILGFLVIIFLGSLLFHHKKKK